MSTLTQTTTTTSNHPSKLLVPGLQCGPYGQRLCVQVADELAKMTPERIYATVTKSPSNIESGFRDVTIRQFADAVNCAAWSIRSQFGESDNFDVIAYIGVSDIRYAIYLYAAIKTGYQLMIPSVRNSESQDLSVFEDAKCTRVYYTPNFTSKIEKLRALKHDLNIAEVPELDVLIGSASTHYVYDKMWADARTDPILIAHSSGSTGNPKPTTITHGVYSTYDNHRRIPKIPGRKIQGYTLLDFEEGGKFYNPFPPFHLAGLFAMTIMPIFYNCTVTTGPPEKPPSGELLSKAMAMVKIRAAWCPPTVIEQLLEQPEGFQQAASLDWIMYTGGPLAQHVGDRLSKVTDVCQLYGSTETGPHIALVPLPENWKWFEWHPLLANAMEDQGDGTYEMVVYKNTDLDWIRHLSQAYPGLDVWKTNDLFVQHPTNPNLWKFQGRKDDVLVLSNGEKFNPVNMEGAIVGHPLVRGALIVGTGRFQASLIVEPKPGLTMSKEEYIENIWPAVQKGNSLGPGHGRIFKNKVVIASDEKPFQRAGKGTVIRGQTVKLYADEVDALYRYEGLEDGQDSIAVGSLDAIENVVRACSVKMMSDPVSDTDDLFVHGMDSLQTLEFTKGLNRTMAIHLKELGQGPIFGSDLYINPTIKKFSYHLHRALNGLVPLHAPKTSDRVLLMEQLIQKYSKGLQPKQSVRAAPSPEKLCVAITGSTGSLGQQLLNKLLQDEKISRIYCLNRAQDAHARHVAALKTRGNDKIKVLEERVAFLTTDFDDAKLGLSAPEYDGLLHNLDVVIHNAWKVNFNHDLASFEDTHVRGIRNLIDLTRAASKNVHILFVSSLSSVGNWPEIHGARTAVPEVAMTDRNTAMKMGYGESKHVAEQILRNAVDLANVNATILRVGQLAGPRALEGNAWNPTEWFPTLMKTSKALGLLPDCMNAIDWIPVDEMAGIIGELLHIEYTAQRSEIFNLANPHSAEWISLIPPIVAAWGIERTKIVSYSRWLDALSAIDANPENLEKYPAIKILDFYQGLAREAQVSRHQTIRYEVRRAAKYSPLMANMGPVDEKAMATWLMQWVL